MTIRALDGPSVQGSVTVTSATVQEAKVGGSALLKRKALTLRADQKIYVYFGDDSASAPNAATVSSDGVQLFKNELVTFEAGEKQPVYLLAVSSTASVKVVERA